MTERILFIYDLPEGLIKPTIDLLVQTDLTALDAVKQALKDGKLDPFLPTEEIPIIIKNLAKGYGVPPEFLGKTHAFLDETCRIHDPSVAHPNENNIAQLVVLCSS